MKNKVSKKLERELLSALEFSFRSNKSKPLLQMLLTRTEKIMLAKRLAIMHMLGKNTSWSKIEKTLKVTPITISRYTKILQTGKNELTEKKIESKGKKSKRNEPSLINAFGLMPPIVGPGRWDFLDRL